MATNEIGVRVKLDGEKQYTEQMRQITQNTKLAAAETKKLEAEWDKSSTEKAAKQAELLNQQIDRQAQSVEMARQNAERYAAETGENSSQTLKWKSTLAEAEAELARLRGELERVPNSMQILGQRMQETGQKIQKVGKGMTTAGRGLTTYVTTPIVAAGAAAVKVTSDFDTSMSKVMALSGATGAEFQTLRKKARQMGATTKFSAGEAADALSYMALAGWDTDQMVEGLDGVMNLAAASGMDLAASSDLVTDYLSAFGLEAKDATRMADQLTYAQANSNTTTEQLGEAFGNSASMMHSAGQSMETTTAILEAFANQGLKGSEAGTALSAMMRDIIQKMKNGKIMIGDTAVQVMDANGNFRDMTDILADVEEATEGMGTAEKDAALMTTFTSRSLKGVNMVLTEGTGTIKGYRDALFNADGTAKRMADTMQDNLAGQLTILKSQLSELGISIGDILVPHIRKAVEWIQKQVDKFNALDDSTKEQIVKFAGLAAAIGPVLLIGGKLVTSIGHIVEIGGKAVSWLGSMSSGSGALVTALNPLGLAFGAVAGLAAIAYAGYKDLENQARDTNGELYLGVDAVNASTESLEDASQQIKDGFEDSKKAIDNVEASARAATTIADELDELTSKSSLTADEQARLKVLVEEMNQLFPEMNLAIDETGNSLNMTSQEIRDYISEAYKMAKAEAYANALKATMENLANAQLAAAKAGIEHERLLEEQQQLEQEVKDKIEAHKRAAENMDEVQRELYLSGTEVNEGYGTQKIALNDATEALEDNEKAQEEANQTIQDAQKEYDDTYAALKALADELGISVEELMGWETAAGDAGEATGEMADDVDEAADEIDESMQKIIDAYDEAARSAEQSVMDQNTAFSKYEPDPTTIQEMQANLDSQIQAYQNYNQNVKRLTSDARYGVDENFTQMVNAIAAAGIDAAPELQAVVDALDDDGAISELAFGYAQTLGDAAKEYGENVGLFTTYTEEGMEATEEALKAGGRRIEKLTKKDLQKYTLDESRLEPNIKAGKEAGESVTKNVADGMEEGNTYVARAGTQTKLYARDTIIGIRDLEPEADSAGEGIPQATAYGIASTNPLVQRNMQVMQSMISGKIVEVRNLTPSAKSATTSVGTGVSSGLDYTLPTVTNSANNIKASVKNRLVEIRDMEDFGKTSGEKPAAGVSTGLANKLSVVSTSAKNVANAVRTPIKEVGEDTTPYASGNNIGQNFSSGVGSTAGSATNNTKKVTIAARNEIKAADNSDPYTWGNHMGQNFANGVASTEGAARNAAQKVANAVASVLKHSTPKEGPLKDDDVWGLHLGQNLANGMLKSVPEIEYAAMEIADSIAFPTSTVMDIDAVSGRNMQEALTLDGLFDVISSAVATQEMTVQIGSREFARILREQGAIA